jgi:hypothetical protein
VSSAPVTTELPGQVWVRRSGTMHWPYAAR